HFSRRDGNNELITTKSLHFPSADEISKPFIVLHLSRHTIPQPVKSLDRSNRPVCDLIRLLDFWDRATIDRQPCRIDLDTVILNEDTDLFGDGEIIGAVHRPRGEIGVDLDFGIREEVVIPIRFAHKVKGFTFKPTKMWIASHKAGECIW